MSSPVLVGLLGVLATLPWWLGRPRSPRVRAARAARTGRRGSLAAVTLDPAVRLDLVDVALASGASIPDALHGLGAAVAPSSAGRELTAGSTALRLGASWSAAWAGCSPVLAPVANALEPAWLDGADPGPLVRRAAAGVRARRQRAAREAAERLGARLVLPLGLCFLPAFVLLSLVPVLLSGGGSLFGGSFLGG